jgi:hypothetical protein
MLHDLFLGIHVDIKCRTDMGDIKRFLRDWWKAIDSPDKVVGGLIILTVIIVLFAVVRLGCSCSTEPLPRQNRISRHIIDDDFSRQGEWR